MNPAHWHLLLNHFPIISVIIGTLVLITGFLFGAHPAIKKIALGIFILSALVCIPAFLTGEGAEEIIENIGAANEAMIEDHEEKAKLFLIFVEVLGAISLFAFLPVMRARNNMFLHVTILIVATFVCILGMRAGSTGGKIRHTEIGTVTGSQPPATMETSDDEEHED